MVLTPTLLTVRHAEPGDGGAWLLLRRRMWPRIPEADHALDIARFFTGAGESAVLIAEDAAGEAVGFAEVSIRPFAEGCVTDRVAYLEAWYVMPEARGRGVGRALVSAVEQWAQAQGCAELASDAHLTNYGGAAAHRAIGFAEVGQIRCFRKELTLRPPN
jgi:aminoglycoside 6'-N-acetyltransferase I